MKTAGRPKKNQMLARIERKHDPILPWGRFVWRLAISLATGMLIIILSLLAGMVGYRSFEKMAWIDAFVNAAMILSGMGPLAQPQTTGGKIFSGLYALYSGFAVLITAGIALAPVIHRMLHLFHADDTDLTSPEK